jgi:hypothetical protein
VVIEEGNDRLMNTRRIAFALATATAGILGVASVAWACVPGHDHGGGADSAGHSVDPALAPSLPVPTVVPAAAIAAAPVGGGFDSASAPTAAAEDGGSSSAVGFVVLAVGVALVIAAVVTGLRRSRSGTGSEPVVD